MDAAVQECTNDAYMSNAKYPDHLRRPQAHSRLFSVQHRKVGNEAGDEAIL